MSDRSDFVIEDGVLVEYTGILSPSFILLIPVMWLVAEIIS